MKLKKINLVELDVKESQDIYGGSLKSIIRDVIEYLGFGGWLDVI